MTMERALKERIIGAIVLVVVVVLVVPVFLDGPPSSGDMVSERVPLPGQEEQKTQTVILERDRSEPVPAQASAESTQLAESEAPVSKPEPQEQAKPEIGRGEVVVDVAPPVEASLPTPKPRTEPAAENPAAAPQQAAESSTGMWAVQLGSFSNQQNAEKLAADLRKQGFAAFLSQLKGSGGMLHRVRIGPQKDRTAAETMATRLKKAGHTGQVVPHP
jgi:DedD protein